MILFNKFCQKTDISAEEIKEGIKRYNSMLLENKDPKNEYFKAEFFVGDCFNVSESKILFF